MNEKSYRQLGRIRHVAGVLLTVLASQAVAHAGGWEIGTVDGSTGGSYSSLRFDKYGNGHVAYVDESKDLLKYSFWDHILNKWFTTALDGASGFCSLALDSKQYPHISYPADGKLKHAYWDGSAWQKQTIPLPTKELAFYTSVAIDPHNNPSITYYEIDGPDGRADGSPAARSLGRGTCGG